jgi:tetratricopeptide (TPR) repeat protein
MHGLDVNALFARAEQAFGAGRRDEARRDLGAVSAAVGDHPEVLHLLALVEKRRGDAMAARRAFEGAAPLAPRDARIASNFANLLADLGEHERALALYGKALAAQPAFRDARFNRSVVLRKLGRFEEALADLDSLGAAGASDAKMQAARGGVLRELGRMEEAAAAFDAALRAEPDRLTALHGRARVAMERGEPDASGLYARALQRKPGDLELVMGIAEALEAEGDPTGLDVMKEAVARNPAWTEGHEVLARMRSEAGEADNFADHYEASLARNPADRALNLSYWNSLARAERYAKALDALRKSRAHLADDPAMRLMEAIFTSETGDAEAALDLFAEAGDPDTPDRLFAQGRAALRTGDAGQAAAMLERVVRAEPGSVRGWAHIDLAWRLTGDPRHEWLSGQPGLYGHRDIGLSADELGGLADLLRSLHRTRAHPIGQSLRGGTQTRGNLFWRSDAALARLREAIMACVADHMDALPPRDDGHPLLRHRAAPLTIKGSWSVRLSAQGFHVNHIHPEGILSSACYISLPPTLGDASTRDGWLELGRPPAELALPLEPLALVEPKPGRLALFPSYLFHGTRPFADGERLTVAFDVAPR